MSRILLALSACLLLPALAAGQIPYQSIYVFGDSLSDTGNLYARVRSATFGLYSYPSPPEYTRYRFTNGPDVQPAGSAFNGVWHEQLADALGVPRATHSIAGGSNFAFGGATTGSGVERFYLFVTSDNLATQTSSYLQRPGTAPQDALFAVWAGGNDLINAATASGATSTTIAAAGQTALNNLQASINTLLGDGARGILWPNLPPLDQTPTGQALSPSLRSALATASAQFRADWEMRIGDLAVQNPSVSFIGVDVYGLFAELSADPTRYGLTNVTGMAVGQPVAPDEYLFWDDLHPTTRGHNLLAQAALLGLAGASMHSNGSPEGIAPLDGTVPEPATMVVCLGLMALLRRRG